MRRTLLLLACALGACSGPPQLILPGKLDLPVASGDRLKLCPDDQLEDTTPDADCVLSTAKNPTGAYVKWLETMGWTPGREAGQSQLLRWISPPKANGKQTCLVIASYATNAGRREGGLLEFRMREMGSEPGASCAILASVRIKLDALDIPLLAGRTFEKACPDEALGYAPGTICVSAQATNAVDVVRGYSRLVGEAGWTFVEGAGAVVRYEKDGRQLTMGFPKPEPGGREILIASIVVEDAPK